MKIYRTQYLPLIGLILLVTSGCNWDTNCRCTETTTDREYNRVYVRRYVLENCNEPFTQTTVYRWGNVVTDCR
jgi:outer membrane phospholipase A